MLMDIQVKFYLKYHIQHLHLTLDKSFSTCSTGAPDRNFKSSIYHSYTILTVLFKHFRREAAAAAPETRNDENNKWFKLCLNNGQSFDTDAFTQKH